ncbi:MULTISPECIES: feruloyl-CoA synthase [unclassified Burkholderia]|uniref:feruloyl-CoA synthase n=1 Tax=unclassified Burkholderia TaxID=2613784 RepID=UPI000F59740A|nr:MULTISPECIES: feruloyl-CoA synthase [unclassified Burkholderia]RQS24206.1 feruloyl-CoA synthase [Burkholderia sp. Bp8995]RQS37930.1 feruloyl-CoA synthase [Burkholderia sp. Bp8989]
MNDFSIPGRLGRSPFDLSLAAPNIERIDAPDGSFVLRSRDALRPSARCIGEWLEHWNRCAPDRVFLAERVADSGEWRRITYGETRAAVGAIAQGLLDLDATPAKPIVILSDNSVDGALLMLAGMHIGLPVSVISSAYARTNGDYEKLRALLTVLGPQLLYAEDGLVHAAAMDAGGTDCPRVFSRNAPIGALDICRLLKTRETAAVMEAFSRITPDTHAKYLLTSGSTGTPKAVINTHGMLCANQQAIAQIWPFVDLTGPVVLDWLPWSHTFGANHNFNLILRNGGTLYIDDGRPMPGSIEKSVRNLSELSPTLYFNVPRGFDALLPYLEQSESLASHFFGGLNAIFFAGAALPQSSWDRIRALADRYCTTPLLFSSGWGATETSPLVTSVHFHHQTPGNLGVPIPGTEIKFVPNGEKLEMRVRGKQVFPGYRGAPALTNSAFDENGFYIIGDAGRLADPADPSQGILFDGRVAEDFKLTTGTWVSVGTLRVRAVAALAPYAQDVVIAGHDRDEVGILIFPSPALRALSGDEKNVMTGEQLSLHAEVRRCVAVALAHINVGRSSSACVARAVILGAPPCLADGEITDKGYVNQRQVLASRTNEVARLFGDGCSVITPVIN